MPDTDPNSKEITVRPVLLAALLALLAALLAGCGQPIDAAGAKPGPALPPAGPAGACHELDGRADRNRNCTPGVTNPDVTQATISRTVCVSGWTKTVRPPASYTNRLKVQQIAEYGYTDTNPADYEEDHLLPLELGGHPKDPHNLWPQPHYGSDPSHAKDQIENELKRAVCAGSMTLDAAQAQIRADWTH